MGIIGKLSQLAVFRMAQNFDGGNIDEIDKFDKFPTIRQYFPYQNFKFSHLQIINLWQYGLK